MKTNSSRDNPSNFKQTQKMQTASPANNNISWVYKRNIPKSFNFIASVATRIKIDVIAFNCFWEKGLPEKEWRSMKIEIIKYDNRCAHPATLRQTEVRTHKIERLVFSPRRFTMRLNIHHLPTRVLQRLFNWTRLLLCFLVERATESLKKIILVLKFIHPKHYLWNFLPTRSWTWRAARISATITSSYN